MGGSVYMIRIIVKIVSALQGYQFVWLRSKNDCEIDAFVNTRVIF